MFKRNFQRVLIEGNSLISYCIFTDMKGLLFKFDDTIDFCVQKRESFYQKIKKICFYYYYFSKVYVDLAIQYIQF